MPAYPVVLEKRPLNGCSSSSSNSVWKFYQFIYGSFLKKCVTEFEIILVYDMNFHMFSSWKALFCNKLDY